MKVGAPIAIERFRRALALWAFVSLLALGSSLALVHQHKHLSPTPDCAACVVAQAPVELESAVAPRLSAPVERAVEPSRATATNGPSSFSYAAPLACGPPAA